MRRWLRLLPLAALTLGSTWSGARASTDRPAAPTVESPATPAPTLPSAIARDNPARPPSSDFAFTNLRRW